MPVNSIARPASSAAAMTSSSRIEPPGWITAVAPGLGRRQQAVGEREEGVRGDRRADRARLGPAVGLGRLARLDGGDRALIAAVHLARADAGGDAVLGIDDGVRLDVLGDGPGEQAVGQFLLGRRALGDAP